jgi:hypothetical protein
MPKPGDIIRYCDARGEDVRAQITDWSRGPNVEVPDPDDPDGNGKVWALGAPLDEDNLVELVVLRATNNGSAENRIVYGRSKVPRAKDKADRQKPGFWWPDA